MLGADLLKVLKVDSSQTATNPFLRGGFTDLQCHAQNIDGICNLLVDVRLHQLLAHPQTQAAHGDAPERHEALISHARGTPDDLSRNVGRLPTKCR